MFGCADLYRAVERFQLMTAPEIQAQIVGFILLALPLIAALWKFFSLLQAIEQRSNAAIDRLERQIADLGHRADLKDINIDRLNDQLTLGINGTKELVNHLRTRTKADDDQLRSKLAQIERYLVKETSYESRE